MKITYPTLTHEKEMLDFAEEKNIKVTDFDLPQCKACSLCTQNGYHIGIDRRLSHPQRKDALMHELGHCETNSFYDKLSGANTIGRMEARADRWAYSHFVEPDDIVSAIREGCRMLYEFADYFDITVSFMKGVFDYYESIGLTL